MFKKLVSLVFSFLGLLFLVSAPTFASNNDLEEPLTFHEISQLKEMGLSEDVIESLNIEELREMIENEVEILSVTSKMVTFDETGGIVSEVPLELYEKDNIISPMALDRSKVKIYGVAYSDAAKLSTGPWKGYRRIKFSGGFEWVTAPAWALTDGLAVGWGNSGIIVPTSSNQVDSFRGEYHRWDVQKKKWYLYKSYTRPSDFDASGGVGFAIDLRGGLSKHKGTITQTAYSRLTTVDTNVKFTYGHRHFSGFGVSFSKSSGFFSVTPTWTVKTDYSADTLSW